MTELKIAVVPGDGIGWEVVPEGLKVLEAVGRKHGLLAGSESAGRSAAAVMSLLATAKANGLDQHAWLKDVLTRLPTQKNNTIDELLPHNWKPAIPDKV